MKPGQPPIPINITPDMIFAKMEQLLGRPLTPLEKEIAGIMNVANAATQMVLQEEMMKAQTGMQGAIDLSAFRNRGGNN